MLRREHRGGTLHLMQDFFALSVGLWPAWRGFPLISICSSEKQAGKPGCANGRPGWLAGWLALALASLTSTCHVGLTAGATQRITVAAFSPASLVIAWLVRFLPWARTRAASSISAGPI